MKTIVLIIFMGLLLFATTVQAAKPPKPDKPGLNECLAKVEQLEQTIDDLNSTILGLQEQLDAMNNYAPVPQTGQIKCYDPLSEAEITCDNTGQDGDLKKGIVSPTPRFIDNGNGTVTDNLTRLVWLKNAHRWDPMLWGIGLSACNQLAADGTSLTDGSQPGDWRLPNVREAMSVIDFGRFDPALPIGHPFDNVWSESNYWTSTVYPYGVGQVYFVIYTRGYVGVRSRGTDHNLVWCVRNPLPPQQ